MMQHRNNMMLKKELICAAFVLVLATLANAKQGRTKRMYAMCPPHFQRIGSECYFMSSDRVNWLDAHFECKDRNSRLAEPYKYEDRLLRKYMQRAEKSGRDFWIGGIFNWQRNKWQWGYNGRDMKYQSFSQMAAGNTQDLKFHCAILNPHLKYRWSARSCVDTHNYICQHRMPYVNEKNRQKVYNKWNETYPNEMANEIEEVINEDDRLRKPRTRNHRPFNPHRQNNVDSVPKQLDPRLENRVDVPRPNSPMQPRRRRPNRQRSPNERDHKNEVQNSAFEPHFNRSRFYRPRNPIDFGDNNNEALMQRRREHQQRRRNRLATTSTTITPPTTTESAPITLRPISADIPNTTENLDDKYHAVYENQLAEERQRREQEEVRRYEEKVRRKQEEEQLRMKEEERRIYEENERRAKHLKDMEHRRVQLENEQLHEAEIEHLRREKQRQDEERKVQNQLNHDQYEEEKQKQAELLRQRELDAQRNAATTLASVLSNDVLDHQPTETGRQQKEPKKLSKEERDRRREALRKRLHNFTPDQQKIFIQRKLERNRKRGIVDDAQRTN